jgi:cytoskeletal protein CcmA (bactofilin family)
VALSSFGRGREGMDNPGMSGPTSSASSSPGGLSAFIDQGSEFEGKLSFKDTVRIDGRFRGEISSDNTLIVGETGEIEAAIHSKSVVVSGSVAGDIHASHKVVLHKTARVEGDVETQSLVIEEGAVLNGQVKMKSPEARKSGGSGSSGSLKAIEGGSEAKRPTS